MCVECVSVGSSVLLVCTCNVSVWRPLGVMPILQFNNYEYVHVLPNFCKKIP